jgi:hypothetical protein
VFLANTSPNSLTTIGNLGELLWPLILHRDPPAPTPEPLPSARVLVARMVDAAGGARVLRSHRTLEIRARKSYLNQGVTASLLVRASAPASRTESETWHAAGREIGRLRLYFDGHGGGQETTFGQDAVNDAESNERARRDYAMHPLLELDRLYREIQVETRSMLGDEPVFVMSLVPASGPKVVLYVSTETALVLQREVGKEVTRFADYRLVQGERIPFRSTITDALGETTVEIDKARFGVALSAPEFAPLKPQR